MIWRGEKKEKNKILSGSFLFLFSCSLHSAWRRQSQIPTYTLLLLH
jgi:hypothetical protein